MIIGHSVGKSLCFAGMGLEMAVYDKYVLLCSPVIKDNAVVVTDTINPNYQLDVMSKVLVPAWWRNIVGARHETSNHCNANKYLLVRRTLLRV